jgi:hypothetical protein
VKHLGIIATSALLIVGACSSNSSSNNADVLATQASCMAYCDAYNAATIDDAGAPMASCPTPFYAKVSDCVASECTPLLGSMGITPSCQGAYKAYYDCEASQADLCADNGCSDQFAALTRC